MEEEDPTLASFLEKVALQSDLDLADMTSERLVLMTGHAAKGLEFDVVFVTGMEEGLIPHSNSLDSQDGIEEERRLAYVGITRARHRLFLTYATERRRFGRTTQAEPSRFLRDLPEASVLRTGEATPYETLAWSRTGSRTGSKTKEPAFDPYAQAMPSYEDESQDPAQPIGPGTSVFHPKFGRGRILKVQGKGERATAEVDFRMGAPKKIILRFLTPC